jgi:hypothetical protein
MVAGAAAAQTPQGSAAVGAAPAVTWSAAAGYESYWLKDVARSTRPVDASPVSWEGHGPAIVGFYDRARPGRLHRVEFSYSSASHFVYNAVVRTFPRSPDDRVVRVGGRYEHRRYPFRDLWIDGLEVGIGAQGIGEHLSYTRHMDPSIEIRESETQMGVAVVAAARFRRWRWLDLEAAWANGGVVSRTSERHSVDSLATVEAWGGGWLTDLTVTAGVPVTTHASVLASYLHSGQGRYASHDTYASGRGRFLVGVKYGR